MVDLVSILQSDHEVVICKARQLGITWLLAGYGLWQSLFGEAVRVLCLSQGEEEAWDLLSKAHFIWEHLPDFLKVLIKHDSAGWICFSTGSEIKALPSTEKAGRGTDATIVIRDELAKHPYGKDNFASISPSIDSGGKLVDLSTIDKLDSENHFTERVNRALSGATKEVKPSGLVVYHGGESGATLVFAGWKLRPVRQEGMTLEDWFETRIKPKYDDLLIEQEYPETLEDALRPSSVKAYFDIDSLESMLLQVTSPIKDFKEFDTLNGMIRVYKPPVVGRQYVIFTDPSNGIEDPFATVVIDSATGEGVCTATGKIPASEVAKIHDMLVRAYNNAYNTGEVNATAGGSFIDTVVTLGTPNRAPRRSPDGKIVLGKVGWQTNEPLRDRALTDYHEALRKQLVTIHDRDGIEQHRRFMRDKNGKPVAMGGEHDDWIMAWAGVWQIRKFAPVGEFKITSSQYDKW